MTINEAVGRVTGFMTRQKRNYRVAVTRSAVNSFLFNLTAPYDSIYTVALGAGSVELGTVNSWRRWASGAVCRAYSAGW